MPECPHLIHVIWIKSRCKADEWGNSQLPLEVQNPDVQQHSVLPQSWADSHVRLPKVAAAGSCPHDDDVERHRRFIDRGLALARKAWPSPEVSTPHPPMAPR